MKVHNRVCACGAALEETRTRSDICRACANEAKLKEKFEEDRKMLESLGCKDLKDPHLNSFKQRTWTFTLDGKERTTTFNNFMAVLKRKNVGS